MFSRDIFNKNPLPAKGKGKPNGHKGKCGKQTHTQFDTEFGHLEGDTIVGSHHHRSAAITLVECLSKVIITLKPKARQAIDIEKSLNNWFN